VKQEDEDKKTKKKSKKQPLWRRIVRVVARVLLFLILFLILLLLFIRSPWGQGIITDYAVDFVSDKTKTEVQLKKVFITFDGAISIEGLYLEDKAGDTLIYSKSLEAEIPLSPIINSSKIPIDDVDWSGLRVNVHREDTINGFNYQFLIDAFASDKPPPEPKKESEPMDISVGTINFSDFKIQYKDQVSGIQTKLDLGNFHLENESFDMQKMDFHINELALKNVDLDFKQSEPKNKPDSKAVAETEADTSSSALPKLRLDDLNFENVNVRYESEPSKMLADVKLGELKLDLHKLNLGEQQVVVDQFNLKNSDIFFKTESSEEKNPKKKDPSSNQVAQQKTTDSLPWPEWDAEVKSIDIDNNQIAFKSGKKKTPKDQFDPTHIALSDFTFKTGEFRLKPNKTARLDINEISFEDQSGFRLKNFVLDVELNQNSLAVKKAKIRTNRSNLSAELNTEFESLGKFVKKPKNYALSLSINPFQLNVKDAYYFKPDLKKQDIVKQLSANAIEGKIEAQGTLAKMNLKSFNLNWGSGFKFNTSGKFTNLTDTENLTYDVPNLTIDATRKTLNKFLPDSLGVSLPETIALKSSLKGSMEKVDTKTTLNTSLGDLNLDAYVDNSDRLQFDVKLDVDKIDVGTIMQMKEFEPISLSLKTSGSGKDLETLDAKLQTDFQQLNYKNYDWSPLKLSGEMKKGKGDLSARFKDRNLNLKLNTTAELDSSLAKASVNLNLIGADLYALGLTKRRIRTQLKLNADYEKVKGGFNANARLDNVTAVYDKKSYNLSPLNIDASVKNDSTSVDISGNLISGELRANAAPGKIASSLGSHLNHYFSKATQNSAEHKPISEQSNPVNLDFQVKITNQPILSEVFLPKIQKLDTLTAALTFNHKKGLLDSQINLAVLNYDGKKIENLQFNLNAGKDDANLDFTFNSLEAGPVKMQRTSIQGVLKNGKLDAGLKSFKDGKKVYNIQTQLTTKNKSLTVHFKPDSLILNDNEWSMPESNSLTFDKEGFHANEFNLNRNGASLSLIDQFNSGDGNFRVEFKDFKLQNITALLNPDQKLLAGSIDGNLKMKPGKNKSKLEANLTIADFQALDVPLGKFDIKTKNAGEGVYKIDAGIKGEPMDLKIDGNLTAIGKSSELNLDVNLKELKMTTLQKFADDAIKNTSGSIAAKIKTSGSLDSLQYDGYLKFNNAEAEIAMLNNKFTLSDEKILINNKRVQFNQFQIKDDNGNPFKVDGKIVTENMTNPEFELTLKADDFMAMDSKKEDNDLYYGKAVFDLDADIGGTLDFPELDVDFTIDEKTDVTYILPQSQASMQKRDGVVEFVNKKNPDAILTRNAKDKASKILKGIELTTNIKIKEGSVFRVVTNPKTNDNLELKGFGDLLFNIARNGDTKLTGQYEINEGHYELSLYNLVNRRFEIAKGSKVTWNGDPMNAKMDVRAIYKVKTTVAPLMASQVSGASAENQNQYNRRLPILVYLNVDGELSSPQLSFALDMPQNSQGAVGGSVYGRIQQLNNQQDQLNKQVFSLLVLNKFYPEPGSDGSQGGAATIARENLGKALSDQLNMLGSKITGDSGIQLNFGVNNYNNPSQGSQGTELNVSAQKKFLDNRLIVDVGGSTNVEGSTRPGESKTTVGNVRVEYLLTKDGRWRLRGFRQSEYENIIEGQVFVSGLSLIFTREFNKLKELFDGKSPKEKEEDSVEEDKDKKSTEGKTDKKTDEKNGEGNKTSDNKSEG